MGVGRVSLHGNSASGRRSHTRGRPGSRVGPNGRPHHDHPDRGGVGPGGGLVVSI